MGLINRRPESQNLQAGKASRRWFPFVIALLVVVVAQGLLAMVIATGGNPVVGAVAAGTLAVCGLVLVMAAAMQTRRRT